MTIERVNPDRFSNVHPRPAPRCYSQQPISQATRQSRVEAERTAVMIALGLIGCVAGFLIVSHGWSL